MDSDLTVVALAAVGIVGLCLSIHQLRHDVWSREGWAFFLFACSVGTYAAALHVASGSRHLPQAQQPWRLMVALWLAGGALCIAGSVLLRAANRPLERESPPTPSGAPEEGVWPPPPTRQENRHENRSS
ncbi:MAG: hypothetical protein JO250_10815 [Armatimonadetes bacterium]|nr:hypothetical protein [Armatimonadota bacterium]